MKASIAVQEAKLLMKTMNQRTSTITEVYTYMVYNVIIYLHLSSFNENQSTLIDITQFRYGLFQNQRLHEAYNHLPE
jgi:hypothetical protein